LLRRAISAFRLRILAIARVVQFFLELRLYPAARSERLTMPTNIDVENSKIALGVLREELSVFDALGFCHNPMAKLFEHPRDHQADQCVVFEKKYPTHLPALGVAA
jgi:hypothetical protein